MKSILDETLPYLGDVLRKRRAAVARGPVTEMGLFAHVSPREEDALRSLAARR